jgi:hypothetical protein
MAIGALLVQHGVPRGDDPSGNAITAGLGISILAAGVTGLSLMGYIILTDTIRNRITVLQDFGIQDYFDSNTTPIKGEYATRFNSRSRNIDIIGLGLSHLRRDFGENLRGWANVGRVRILLIDPTYPNDQCSLADQRDREERDPLGSIRADVNEWISQTLQLRSDLPTNFQIHLYRCLPTITMARIDDEAFWSPYLMHRGSGSTPTMLVRRGGLLYDVLVDHFDQIWNDSTLSKPIDDLAHPEVAAGNGDH